MTIISIAASLFLLMDSIGNVPIFISILKEISPSRQKTIILRELLIALFIIIAFYFLGNYLLGFLGISQQAVLISGGIILFIIGIKLVFPPHEKTGDEHKTSKEPFLVPLAVPLVSGPAVLATVMLYSHQGLPFWNVIGGILIAWAATTIILLSSLPLKRVLGERGLIACERFTGLVLIMLAVQMFLNGLSPLLPK